jgi:hypothetical protein
LSSFWLTLKQQWPIKISSPLFLFLAWWPSWLGPLGHVSYCHHFSSVVHRPSVNISHFNLLLRNHWANCNQTLVEWSLDGPLPKLCPVIPTSNQDGHQAKNRKKGGWNFNEEKIKMWNVDRRTMDDRRKVMTIAHMA